MLSLQDAVNSGIFIDFMLQEIYETLKKRQGDPIVTMKATKDVGIKVGINVGINEQKVLELMRKNNQIKSACRKSWNTVFVFQAILLPNPPL